MWNSLWAPISSDFHISMGGTHFFLLLTIEFFLPLLLIYPLDFLANRIKHEGDLWYKAAKF